MEYTVTSEYRTHNYTAYTEDGVIAKSHQLSPTSFRTQQNTVIFPIRKESCVLCAGLPANSGGLAEDPDGPFSSHQSP